jgi:hypothetical protein
MGESSTGEQKAEKLFGWENSLRTDCRDMQKQPVRSRDPLERRVD